MATDTHDRYVSNVLLYTLGERPEYAIDVETVNVTAGMTTGAVLWNNSGTWTLVDQVNVGNAAGVLVDERAIYGDLPTGNTSLKVAKRTCAVSRDFLSYAADVDLQAERDTAEAALIALGILIEDLA